MAHEFEILTTVEEIKALPNGAVIQLEFTHFPPKTLELIEGHGWFWAGVESPYTKVRATWVPARLLYHPDWDQK